MNLIVKCVTMKTKHYIHQSFQTYLTLVQIPSLAIRERLSMNFLSNDFS